MKLIVLSDEKALKEAGIPWARSYIFKLRHYNTYPKLIVKVGRRLMIDVDEFHRLVKEDVTKREKMKKRIDEVLKKEE